MVKTKQNNNKQHIYVKSFLKPFAKGKDVPERKGNTLLENCLTLECDPIF